MNEFLQQFVIESRELADTASDCLLALEHSPSDAGRLDEVFRAFHTLKGGAGIVEFPAMESAMHAAEKILSEARAGTHPLTSAGIGECLAHLDRVADWLDAIERAGELPADAGSRPAPVIAAVAEGPAAAWLTNVLERNSGTAAAVLAAVRFVPAADSFYRGEDPLGLMTSLPGLLALELEAREPWGPLDALDPFHCNLVLTALSAATPAQLQKHLTDRSGDCAIVPIAARNEEAAVQLPPRVAALIEAQQALLREDSTRGFAGRVASAGAAATNALRFCGLVELSDSISRAMEQSLLAHSGQPLRDSLAKLLIADLPPAQASAADSVPAPEAVTRTLRIEAQQVDALVRLAGELTVANNAIGHVVGLAQTGDPSTGELLKTRHEALERLIDELRATVLRMRVRPLRAILRRFPRLVREMSAKLGKPVRLVIEGEQTEADKAIVEMLFEPLLHVLRNAMDHGVESASARAAAGKPATATIAIKAQRSGDRVLIEVSDDGAGIDLSRVRAVAVESGLITQDRLLAMTEAETLDLIFAPGFSTAASVTEISGRGVGMDAVRRTVERVGGHVSVSSVAGRSTEVTLSLPFSAMMSHVMTVEAGGQLFGLPLEAIIETIRVPRAAISRVGAAPVVVVRDRTLPVVDLATALGMEPPADGEWTTLVVAAANGECCAFQVDRIVERLDLILKPLEGLLAGTPGITGTTLLGDGRVLLVLDIGEMLQ